MSGIEVEGLTKRFGTTTAVEDVSFSVEPGEVFGFLGPNGAGKTTTVRILTGLIRATSGRASVAGIPIERSDEVRRRIGVMPEAAGLYGGLTVADNLAFFGELHGVPRAEIDARIDRALGAVSLQDRREDRAGTLSKGLRQRTALARTLMADPQVLFLDEPTAGLDPEASAEFRDLVGDLRGAGVTIFLTTHRLDEAARLCDRVAILATKVITVGRPDELGRDDRTVVEVRTRAPVPDGLLEHLDGVSDVATVDGALRLHVRSVDEVVPVVVRRLVESGVEITAVHEVARSLEDTYLALVGRGRS